MVGKQLRYGTLDLERYATGRDVMGCYATGRDAVGRYATGGTQQRDVTLWDVMPRDVW